MRRVDVEVVAQAARDAEDDPLVARPVEPLVHWQPSRGLRLSEPAFAFAERSMWFVAAA